MPVCLWRPPRKNGGRPRKMSRECGEKVKSSQRVFRNPSKYSRRSWRSFSASFLSSLLIVLFAGSCLKPSVRLNYEFPEGRTARYRWSIEARSSLDSAVEVRRDIVISKLNVQQRVLGQSNEGNAQVRFVIEPTELRENGVKEKNLEATVLDVEITPEGRIARVVRSAHLPPAALHELQLDTLLGEVLPPLPNRELEINDRWAAPLKAQDKRSRIDLTGTGRLSGFRLKDRSRRASIDVIRKGAVTTSQRIGRTDTTVSGTSRIDTNAEIDVDRHLLASSNSVAKSVFDVATGGTAQGRVELLLKTRIELL
jgi:hypothetical protein